MNYTRFTRTRGDLLALGLARLNTLAPNLVCTGLSATVAEPDSLRRYLTPQTEPGSLASLVVGAEGAAAQVDILDTKERLPRAVTARFMPCRMFLPR